MKWINYSEGSIPYLLCPETGAYFRVVPTQTTPSQYRVVYISPQQTMTTVLGHTSLGICNQYLQKLQKELNDNGH